MAKVTGIGGVFFKAKDPEGLAVWYQKHLGVPLDPKLGIAILHWGQDPAPDGGCTVWALSQTSSDGYPNSFMINYRVDDLDGMLSNLRAAGVPIVKGPDTDFNGIFAWILDPEGNRVELWQPTKIKEAP